MTQPYDRQGVPIKVLLVEDDPGDVLMTREAFAEHKVRNRLNVVADGADALAYLRKEGEFSAAVTPDLIPAQLSPARQRVCHQAGRLRHVHLRRAPDRRFLRHRGETALVRAEVRRSFAAALTG